MKITKIEIKNYRGFPANIQFDLTKDGKNLILFGENGSGKSSLFHGLSHFFSHLPRSISENKNIFHPNEDIYIKLSVGDGNNPDNIYEWSGESDVKDEPIIRESSKTKGFIDYKDILNTSYLYRFEENINLFNLLIRRILNNVQSPISQISLLEEWAKILTSLEGRQSPQKNEDRNELIQNFNDGVIVTLNNLINKANEILALFDPNVKINLIFKTIPIPLPKSSRTSTYRNYEKILLEVDYFGSKIQSPHVFLNEARLTAIGLSLYLASFLQYPISDLKLLVLDDVLIGLDLSNRLPLLKILDSEFSNWQIVLMTYDKVWFDLVRMRKSDWSCQELFATDSLVPMLKSNCDFLHIAREHLVNNDDHAAAVYARAEFERKLKKFCEKLHVKLSYKQPPDQPTSGEMLDGLENHLKDDPKWSSDSSWQTHYPKMFLELRAVRKTVLNPLSHSELITLAKAEVQQAIDAVDRFTLIK
jgi:energy-coupling factor transporter ATP-binding protein EcfA2